MFGSMRLHLHARIGGADWQTSALVRETSRLRADLGCAQLSLLGNLQEMDTH